MIAEGVNVRDLWPIHKQADSRLIPEVEEPSRGKDTRPGTNIGDGINHVKEVS